MFPFERLLFQNSQGEAVVPKNKKYLISEKGNVDQKHMFQMEEKNLSPSDGNSPLKIYLNGIFMVSCDNFDHLCFCC